MFNYVRLDGEFPIIVSEKRAARPHLHKQKKTKACPFCPGNEDMTPPSVLERKRSDGSWYIRVFENAFPFVRPDNVEAYGYHEVVVETDEHDRPFHSLPAGHIAEVIQVWGEREYYMYQDEKIQYVAIFKNHGADAGASIPHSHSQIAGITFIPPRVEYRLRKYPPSPSIHIFSGEFWSVVAPLTPRFAYEVRIQPRIPVYHVYELNYDQRFELARILKALLQRVSTVVDAYNIAVFTSPRKGMIPLHLEIYSRKNKHAGFELETGAYVVPVSPETTAKFYSAEDVFKNVL
ncbi:MAG: UDPglucose--hexose-phosphate uridylyltransferase [Candidatus Diapherotrites archaeon]|nr:UDPglucose--hexose-phosphate uridylyltransferase [Candidatus Diapherotrites archaeon]